MKTQVQIKKQTRKVGVSGGFINQMMGNNSTTPVVGKGATILSYSDRHAYEVIEVSNDGNSCVIREMDATFVGSGYGDERYTYKSNPENHTKNLEWNSKKQKWGEVYFTTEIIKSLAKAYDKKYGWGWYDILMEEKGLTYDDIVDGERDGCDTKLQVIDGLTKQYKNFNPISIIFGVMEKYQDPSF
jgi:hypothetical protein